MIYDVGNVTTYDFQKSISTENYFCYRVRALTANYYSNWSNVECVAGNYYDDFSSSSSGWDIRRQDTDDIENYNYYENGNYVLEIDGRWDYGLAAPLKPAPTPPYSIKTRVRLESADNLNSYGLIFGGDWNGQPCPNADYSSCFNHYYRLNIVWFGSVEYMKLELKRIDYHDPNSNSGRGVELIPFSDIKVGSPTSGWKEWEVKVFPDGTIQVFLGDTLVGQAVDATYVNDYPYFGVFASSNEYLGAEPWFDWYSVEMLP